MRHALVLLVGRERCALVHAEPPAAKFHVVVLVVTIGHPRIGQIGDHEQHRVQFAPHGVGGVARQTLLITKESALLGQRSGDGRVAAAPCVSHSTRELFDLGSQSFGFLEKTTVFYVQRFDLLHR